MRIRAGSIAALLALVASAARAQTYTIAKEESGAAPSSYTRRWNWSAQASRPYYMTTVHDDSRLDPSRAADADTSALRHTGTATARAQGMVPGVYQVWATYPVSCNRSRCVRWIVTNEGADQRRRVGEVDQRDPSPDCDTTSPNFPPPIVTEPHLLVSDVVAEGALTLALGWDDPVTGCKGGGAGFDGDSIGYAGARFVRTGPLPVLAIATPTLDPPAGTWPAPLELTLACATAGASIEYTTDGTNPTGSATARTYSGPFRLNASATVRARAFVGTGAARRGSYEARAEYVVVPPDAGAPTADAETPPDARSNPPDAAALPRDAGSDLPDAGGEAPLGGGCGCAATGLAPLPLLLLALGRRSGDRRQRSTGPTSTTLR